ncbi:FecR family protein [Chitinophaga pinensis]|uniref:Anti-FecI sigma factor, FecR n=1 Tax=Chitinophaga pinensis (strain ATCC 43595 / DSM 2588 / LMG 13176 / NBRC 15968 / NCIMB 11800 / UQM 2034) TaxID=485918 RepID=A0A979G147_CHIPD|nr:FecR family protein [Chitinophaga pinensis]ACU58853.1 anti-FecI sigma factor, FecR [Chitinophaga pinensis DSM 2588]
MDEQAIKALLEKYKAGAASEEELALLESWYSDYEEEGPSTLSMEKRLAAVDEVWQKLGGQPARTRRLWPRIAVAAAAVLVILFVSLYYTGRQQPKIVHQDIVPGSNKAILTLTNGKTIDLSSQKTGVVINTTALAYDDGTPIAGDNDTRSPQLMVLHTPRGGTYQIVLPDGTKVWLNAASTLKFPASFANQQERKIALTGEAYFEVAPAARQPFLVDAGTQQIQVLGTHFNINAYEEEETPRTTLLEGSIRVGQILLKPGEQAAGALKITAVNVDEIMGWKNGYFVFENEQLPSVMRKIARWYDVDVRFNGEIPTDEFGGRVSRSSNLSQVLRKLELTNKVHFNINGRTITVTK